MLILGLLGVLNAVFSQIRISDALQVAIDRRRRSITEDLIFRSIENYKMK